MKETILLCVFCLFFSCDNKSSQYEQVNLEIINRDIISNKEGLEKNGNPIKNILTYKLTNNSDEKIFFILDEDNISSVIPFSDKDLEDPLFFGNKGRLLYDISTDKNVKPISPLTISDNISEKNIDCMYDIQKINELKNRISELGLNELNEDSNFINDIRKNSFILYPNQSKYFKSVLYLPKKIDTISKINSEIKFDYNEIYKFNIMYLSDKEIIKNSLPDYKLKELKENDIKIFNGKLLSNKVSIKFIE